MTYCSQFPFNCTIESNNLTNDKLFYSVPTNDTGVYYKVNKYNFLYSTIYPSYKYLVLFYCEELNNQECEYVINSKRNEDYSFIEESSGKNFLKIIDSIAIGENRNYMFFR